MLHPRHISISDYDYHLPEDRIAVFPNRNRDASKLLVYKDHRISEGLFGDIANHLPPACTLVFNNTRVIQARMIFRNSNGREIEIFCLEPAGDVEITQALAMRGHTRYNCLVGNLRRWKEELLVAETGRMRLSAKIEKRQGSHQVISFSWQPEDHSFAEILQAFGQLPIPPYLNRQATETDATRYQTVYAQLEGSVAAPTAGLHFTPELLTRLSSKGISSLTVTLHVGAGTFKPVKSDTLTGHEMHAEWLEVDTELVGQLAGMSGQKIIAVGTTSLRTLESLYWMGLKVKEGKSARLQDLEIKQWEVYERQTDLGRSECLTALYCWLKKQEIGRLVCKTQIIIAPPYTLRVCDGIITNFHQPKSTLLLIIAAITGNDWRAIYEYALSHNFRFLSYGDSSLLLK